MAKAASATGLIEARIRPVYRPKPKRIELSGSTKPVPFILRPFSGLYNPYPYGCSVLCNHPADCEAKEVLRRAKDSWATEGKALLLPEEMEMIKANLMTTSGVTGISGNIRIEVINTDEATVPEELFRKYTETDSRPLTPAPTLASGPVLTSRPIDDEFPVTFKEALRVKGETYSRTRRSQTSNPALSNTPRVFSRQVARFEILDSGSLKLFLGLTVMDYLSKHVFVSSGRKLIFGRFFNKYQDDTTRDVKKILPHNIPEALQEVIGKPMTEEQETHFKFLFGEIEKPLNFRSWCGLCAAVERLFCPLPQKEVDSASWLERVDFETLERRLGSVVNVDPKLAMFLREIREK